MKFDPLSFVPRSDHVSELQKRSGGDFDLDSLCSQLKAKAKCSGGGGGGSGMDPKDANIILSPEPTPGQNDVFKMFS